MRTHFICLNIQAIQDCYKTLVMTCSYSYFDIYDVYLKKLESIFIDRMLYPDIPFPLYTKISDYITDTNEYKGLLVFDSIRYHKGEILKELMQALPASNKQIGYFVVPEMGEFIPDGWAINQLVVIHIDSNTELDRFEKKLITTIDWILNKHKTEIEETGLNMMDKVLFSKKPRVSKKIYVDKSPNFIRRSITFSLTYCSC